MVVRKRKKVERWYYIILSIALLWNLLGVSAFVMQIMMTPEAMANLPPAERELYANIPIWSTVAFGVAVLGGTLGCIGLLLRKQWGLIVLWLSLLGILTQMTHVLLLSDVLKVSGPGAAVMPILITVVAVALIIIGRNANTRHWLD
ncbi:MAG: hypothetical protein ABJ056_11445 [Halioglobus sp.]